MLDFLETLHGGLVFGSGSALTVAAAGALETGRLLPEWFGGMCVFYVVSALTGVVWLVRRVRRDRDASRRLGLIRYVDGQWVCVPVEDEES